MGKDGMKVRLWARRGEGVSESANVWCECQCAGISVCQWWARHCLSVNVTAGERRWMKAVEGMRHVRESSFTKKGNEVVSANEWACAQAERMVGECVK